MTEPNEAMKAMAQSVYSQFIIDNTPGAGPGDVPKFDDNAHGVRIALAAIIETQRLDAEALEAERVAIDPDNPNEIDVDCNNLIDRCLDIIRTGNHYAKDESHG